MNIKVITRHIPSNYGSLLQSIATVFIIERLGYSCQIIDYQRKDERGIKAVLASLRNKKNWNSNPFKKAVYISLRYPFEYIAQCKFGCMRKKYLKMTKKCVSIKELSQLKSDVFMTGSDQVWGPVLTRNFDEAYFLSFVHEAKKTAYAASFGKTQFSETVVCIYKKMLSSYDAIAVRENNAVELLRSWNIPCVGQVLDPTLLLAGDDWDKYIEKNIEGNYILVYQLHNNPALNEYAKQFSLRTKMPLIRISSSFHQLLRGGKFVYLPNLGTFLSYIKNCSYLITDSFHGTAFALIFNKQFVEILPNNNTSGRNQSILQLTGLSNRILQDYTDFSFVEKKINYSKVNEIIDAERIKSYRILREIIE